MVVKKVDWQRFKTLKPKRGTFSRRAKKAEGATLRHAHRFILSRLDNLRSVRRHIIVWMLGVALLIMAVILQSMWFQQGYTKTAPVSGGVYAEAVQGPLNTVNPLYATSVAERSVSHLLFSSLYSYDSTGHLSNDLARTMSIDDSGKVYTIKIRTDALWHDGQPVTAKDIAFTVQLMKDPAVRSTMLSSWKDIDAKALDASTVQLTLPAAYAAFPQALTFAVLPEHILASVDKRQLRESTFSSSPVGSGPFTYKLLQALGDTTEHRVLYLAANKAYYRHAPKLDRFQLHVYDSMTRIKQALQTGEVSSAAGVSSDVARAIDQSRYAILSKPINSGVYAILNTTQPALKDAGVRQALLLATDTTTIRKGIYGEPHALDLPFVDGQLEGADIPKRPAPNVKQAAALLDKAGWVTGKDGIRTKDNQQLRLRLVTRKGGDMEYILAQLKKQWGAVGVVVDGQAVDTAAVGQDFTQTYLQPRNYDVLLDELMIGADPDVFAYWHSRGLLNFANYSDPRSDDALISARGRVDTELRNVKYKAFAKQWLNDVPAIGIYQSNMLYIESNRVSSLGQDETIVSQDNHYAGVQYWTAERGTVFTTP